MSDRECLRDRRQAELVNFEHAGRRWTVTLGLSPMNGSAVFLDMPKASAIGEIAADAAVTASIAFQFGAPLETVRHALADRLAGPLGAALALIAGTAASKQEKHNG
jgi:hypothetical protein